MVELQLGENSMSDGGKIKGLQHGLTNYGDKDFSLYLRRSFAKSMGYSDEMLFSPNCSSTIPNQAAL